MRPLAHLLSVLLHPLWMPSFAMVLCWAVDPWLGHGLTSEGLWLVLGMIFAMTAFFPLTGVLLMRRNGLVGSLAMPLRRERLPVYGMTLLYYGMCYYLLRRTLANPLVLAIMLGCLLTLLLVLMITLRWKISAHMAGIGGVLGAVFGILVMGDGEAPAAIGALFLMAGALGSARLLVSDHSPAQVYAGALLGAVCVYGCTAFGLSI